MYDIYYVQLCVYGYEFSLVSSLAGFLLWSWTKLVAAPVSFVETFVWVGSEASLIPESIGVTAPPASEGRPSQKKRFPLGLRLSGCLLEHSQFVVSLLGLPCETFAEEVGAAFLYMLSSSACLKVGGSGPREPLSSSPRRCGMMHSPTSSVMSAQLFWWSPGMDCLSTIPPAGK